MGTGVGLVLWVLGPSGPSGDRNLLTLAHLHSSPGTLTLAHFISLCRGGVGQCFVAARAA